MLARPARRATYHRALRSGELIPQNERELRRSQGSASRCLAGNFHLTSVGGVYGGYRGIREEWEGLPLSDPRLCLPLAAGGGGAWVARLAFWAHLWSSDRDGLGPLVVRSQTWTLSRTFSRSVWYAFVCNEATVWPAAAYALPFKRDSGA